VANRFEARTWDESGPASESKKSLSGGESGRVIRIAKSMKFSIYEQPMNQK
jgi:hypothetical protein